ncbi:MAG: hypothetical protein R3293_24205, partial [Candidatus Promineifilaceae bacterium]|nr:hypothetical protein [Candidatus Promineifilaceae bacterium]
YLTRRDQAGADDIVHPESDRIVLICDPQTLKDNADVREFHLNLAEVGTRKSYRNVKHYKRRKR